MNHSQYFYRTAVFALNNGQVSLADIDNPKQLSPLEPWFGVVIPLADGLHTLGELVTHISNSYPGSPPADLTKTLDSVVERLVEGKLLALSEKPVKLPYYLSAPIEELDREEAKKLMSEDGLTLQ